MAQSHEVPSLLSPPRVLLSYRRERSIPTGTVTFLFTDIDGSTRLLHGLGPEAYSEALAEHRQALHDAFAAHGGVEVATQGDAFFCAFPPAEGTAGAALQARHFGPFGQDLVSSSPGRTRTEPGARARSS